MSTGEDGLGGVIGYLAPPSGKPRLCRSVSHLASHLDPLGMLAHGCQNDERPAEAGLS